MGVAGLFSEILIADCSVNHTSNLVLFNPDISNNSHLVFSNNNNIYNKNISIFFTEHLMEPLAQN